MKSGLRIEKNTGNKKSNLVGEDTCPKFTPNGAGLISNNCCTITLTTDYILNNHQILMLYNS